MGGGDRDGLELYVAWHAPQVGVYYSPSQGSHKQFPFKSIAYQSYIQYLYVYTQEFIGCHQVTQPKRAQYNEVEEISPSRDPPDPKKAQTFE